MTHDSNAALAAVVSATRAYQTSLRARRPAPAAAAAPPDDSPAPAAGDISPEALARLTAPEVSRLIARDVRERRSWP